MLPLNDPLVSPPVLGVEENHEVERVRIWRQRLIVPFHRTAPIDDLPYLGAGLAEHFLQHEVGVDRRHAPDDGLHRSSLNGTVAKVLGGRFLGGRR
jgi:hypothetical protein